jgi:thiol-disulfide isomerase/thioredoxin
MLLALFAACVPVLTSPPGSLDSGGEWTAPENTWGICDGPPAGFEGTGLEEGEIAPDFLLADQFGDPVSLWQFHGCPVLLDFSTMWCGPCQELASEAQELADDYASFNLKYITVMPQDLGDQPPDQDELVDWSESFGLYEPILSDTEDYTWQLVTGGRGFPAALLLDENGVVVDDIDTVSDAGIRAALDELLK